MKKIQGKILLEEREVWKQVSSLNTLLRVFQDWKDLHNQRWRVVLLRMNYQQYKRPFNKERRIRAKLGLVQRQPKTLVHHNLHILLINGINLMLKSWLRGVLADTKP